MSRTIGRLLIQVLGTLGGLLGLMLLVLGWSLFGESGSPTDGDSEMQSFLVALFLLVDVLMVGIGVFLIHNAGLLWFRFSPRAVRRFGGLAVLVLCGSLADTLHDHLGPDGPPWAPLAGLGTVVLAFVVYDMISKRLVRWFFSAPGTPPEASPHGAGPESPAETL
ncbi:MAG: hypothetical protein H7A46_04305 [Verrucomicrobiales bacterium]|nr:hypothetical protein [Verrucomicrobiales bacterium]